MPTKRLASDPEQDRVPKRRMTLPEDVGETDKDDAQDLSAKRFQSEVTQDVDPPTEINPGPRRTKQPDAEVKLERESKLESKRRELRARFTRKSRDIDSAVTQGSAGETGTNSVQEAFLQVNENTNDPALHHTGTVSNPLEALKPRDVAALHEKYYISENGHIKLKPLAKTSKLSARAKTTTVSRSRLLELPAELRLSIWEMVIIPGDRIAVDSSFKPPALLAVNRQIRHETKSAWLYNNTFSFHIVDCDASLFHTFIKTQMAGDEVSPKNQVKLHFMTGKVRRGVRHWKNLMLWCETLFKQEYGVAMKVHDHDDEWEGKAEGKHLHEMDVTVSNATRIAIELHAAGVQWEVCERVLGRMRQAVATREPDWLIDHE